MKAARIVKLNEPLEIQDLQTPKPKGSQILIKILSSGVCHSDQMVWAKKLKDLVNPIMSLYIRG